MSLIPYTAVLLTKEDAPYNIIPNANIEIRFRNSDGSSAGLALIFEDELGATPIAQPGATTDEKGMLTFYVASGEYNLVYSDGATVTRPISVAYADIINDLSQAFIFDTVADMVASTIVFPVGKTIGRYYYGDGDKGYAEGVVKTAAQASSDGDIIDGYANVTLDNGNVWIINNSNGFVTSWQFGAVENAENSLQLAAIDAYCRNTGVKLVWLTDSTLDETYRMKTGKFEMDFTGSTFTSNKQTTGNAWEFAPDDDGVTLPTKNTVYKVKGFSLQAGSYITTNHNCDGVSFGKQADQVDGESSRVLYENIIVRGSFSYSTNYVNELFINSIINPYFTGGWNGCARFLTATNAGENINIHGGVIANAHNDTDSGVNLLIDTNANADVYLNGTSIDYGDIQILQRSGAIHGTAHIEGNSAETDIQLIETNNQPVTFNLTGGTIATGPNNGVGTEEPADGKASRIEVDGSKVNVCLTGVGNSLRDKFDTEIVTVNSGSPIVSIKGIFYDTSVDKPALLSRYLTRIRNGDFENNLTQSWTLNGTSGASIGTSSAEAYRGTYSLEFVGTAGGSFSAVQTLMPMAGVKYICRCRMKITAYTSGNMQLLINFKDWQGNTVGSRTALLEPQAVGDWVLVADNAPIPAPTYEIEIQIKAISFIGTAYVDDIVVNVID